MRRNGTAVGEMAQACADAGAAIVVVSTNEVFDGRRIDGLPYGPTDRPNPGNPYGAAKLAGETAARAAYGATGDGFAAAATAGVVLVGDAPAILPLPAVPALAIVRTAWLCGLPGLDFPQKIVAAAEKARGAGQTLSLVSDEVGCPTYAPDLAGAIVALIVDWGRPGGRNLGGIHHIINTGRASRAEWAREILRLAGIDIVTNEVPLSTWPRPSNPPAWGVLEATPLPGGFDGRGHVLSGTSLVVTSMPASRRISRAHSARDARPVLMMWWIPPRLRPPGRLHSTIRATIAAARSGA